MANDAEKGWDWIVAFYGRPAVKTACLLLQDKHGVDVTFLLYLCWLDAHKAAPPDHYLTLYLENAGPRSRIRLIRKCRRFVSRTPFLKTLKPRLLAWEIEKEKGYFLGLAGRGAKKGGDAVQAKNYITYMGALLTAAAKVILRELKT